LKRVHFIPQAVIFDMDGLLVDSEPLWADVELEILNAYGREHRPEVQHSMIGRRLTEFWAHMKEAYELPEPALALMDRAVGRFIERTPAEMKPKPGAPELLDHLYAIGTPCAIASSSPLEVINAVVAALGWDDRFRVRVSGEEVPNGKPAPDIYLETARRLSVPPAACLALEDSPTGARAAVAAGMTCIAIPDQSHTHPSRFDDITPYVFESLHDVLALLRENEGHVSL